MGLGHGCNYLPKLKMAFQTAQNWKILSLRERGERLAPVFEKTQQGNCNVLGSLRKRQLFSLMFRVATFLRRWKYVLQNSIYKHYEKQLLSTVTRNINFELHHCLGDALRLNR